MCIWDVITHPYYNFNGGLTELKLGMDEWLYSNVLRQYYTWMLLIINTQILMAV